MRIVRGWIVALAVAGALAGCGDPSRPSPSWEAGGIYSISDGSGEFGVAKILALEPDAVSVRVYREKFPTRPSSIDAGELSLGTIDDPEGFGIGHLPLAPADFVYWFPVHIVTEPVSEAELDGYRYWKEQNGGVFSLGDPAAEPTPDDVEAQAQ